MAKLIILGAGESGYGAAKLGVKMGYDVFISNDGQIKPTYQEKIERIGVPYEQGQHTMDIILGADLIVKSPGVPDANPVVQAALAKGIKVISEIEFAARHTDAKKICITGSNGKTTTTTLIYEIMKNSGMSVAVAGNIGKSFAGKIADDQGDDGEGQYEWYVIELSSFQLDGVYDFRADIALLLNITPDHLDRYEYKMEKYVSSKLRISRNQTSNDTFIYNADDPVLLEAMPGHRAPSSRVPFSVDGKKSGAYYDGVNLIFEDFVMAASDLEIKGKHNIANALAAVVATKRAGVRNEDICRGLRGFKAVEHRMEPVAVVGGIEFINDSKATNVDSVHYALESMTKPTVWIAGGTDKGNDYEPLKALAKDKVKALVCMGVDNKKLMEAFAGIVPIIKDTNSLTDAVNACREIAQSGDCVLLSPACASFDLFRNFEQRGELFKAEITKI